MGVAFLFAGQASQAVGMGADLAAACADCRATFESADAALGFPLFDIMAHGPAEVLDRTAVTQPAVLSLSVAHARHLLALGARPDVLGGHSLGQYSALVAGGAIAFNTALRLVAERGRLMQETVPQGVGAMMSIIGLDKDQVGAACGAARSEGVVSIATYNAPGNIVISGKREAVEAAADYCENEGATVVPLATSAPFHCELLAPMVPSFAEYVDATAFQPPTLPVIDNLTSRPFDSVEAVRCSLIAEITQPAFFEDNLRYMADAGIDRFIQCGPGKSLLGFVKRVAPRARRLTFDEAAAERW